MFVAIQKCMRGLWGLIGSFLFLAGTIGTVLGGIFIPDPINTAPDAVTASGNLHNLGGAWSRWFSWVADIGAKLLRDGLWRSARRSVSVATAIIVLGFIVSFVSIVTIATQHRGVFGPDTPVGWPNRLGIMSGCAWLMIVGWRAIGTKCQSPENSGGL